MGSSRFSKFHKIYKIVIALTFFVILMFSIFNCFCFASSEVEGTFLEGSYLQYITDKNGQVISRDDGLLIYYPLSFGHRYSFVNNSGHIIATAFLNKVPEVGDSVFGFNYVNAGDTKTFLSDEEYLVFTVSSSTDLNNIALYDETPGFSGVIGNLSLSVGLSQLWGTFISFVPFVGIVILFSFGFGIYKKLSNGVGSGKVK